MKKRIAIMILITSSEMRILASELMSCSGLSVSIYSLRALSSIAKEDAEDLEFIFRPLLFNCSVSPGD